MNRPTSPTTASTVFAVDTGEPVGGQEVLQVDDGVEDEADVIERVGCNWSRLVAPWGSFLILAS